MSLSHWVWLTLNVEDAGLAVKLIEAFGKPERVYTADFPALMRTGLLRQNQAERLCAARPLDAADAVLRRCTELGVQILTLRDAAYPERLRNIPDPPLLLYALGTLPHLDDLVCVCIVGTRHTTPHAAQIAVRFSSALAQAGVCVISGMASGIDSAAHTGALSVGAATVAVFGNGVDICYPSENRPLMERILAHGCILSEYPPGRAPDKYTFPRRNRILAGLSCGTLVVSAPIRSGSLITARIANEYGRDVFIVPGDIDDAAFKGSNEFLKSGAMPVTSPDDILSLYRSQYRDRLGRRNDVAVPPERKQADPQIAAALQPTGEITRSAEPQRPAEPPRPVEPYHTPKRETVRVPDPAPGQQRNLYADLDEQQMQILQAIREDLTVPDYIIGRTGLPVTYVLQTLTQFELKGICKRIPGGRYILDKTYRGSES